MNRDSLSETCSFRIADYHKKFHYLFSLLSFTCFRHILQQAGLTSNTSSQNDRVGIYDTYSDLAVYRIVVLSISWSRKAAGKCSLHNNSIWYNAELYYASLDKDIDSAYRSGKKPMCAEGVES